MFVFVGCSYSPWPVAGYKDAFHEAMREQQALVFEFADVRIENTWILEKVQKHIERCDFGIFDITFLNPNVMMELGIALGMKKRAHIFINETADQRSGFFSKMFSTPRAGLPVNLQGLELVRYGSKFELKRRLIDLSAALRAAVDQRTLNHSSRVRNLVLDLVRAHSGLRINEIGSKSGETIEFVKSALQRLRKEKLVRTEGRSSGMRYFAVVPTEAPLRRAGEINARSPTN